MVRQAHQPWFDPSTSSGTVGPSTSSPTVVRPFDKLRDRGSTLRQAQGPWFDPSTGSGTALRQAQGPWFDRLTNRGSTLRQAQGPWALRRAQGPQGQGTPLTVWLIKKADIVRKRDFHKDKSLFLWNISRKSLSLHRKTEC